MKISQDLMEVMHLNISQLEKQLLSTPEAFWKIETFRQETDKSQLSTQAIIMAFSFHYPSKEIVVEYRPVFNVFKEVLSSILAQVQQKYPGQVLKMFFARLNPHSAVGIHSDKNYSFDIAHRLVVPIVTDENCLFKVYGEQDSPWVHLKEGVVYEFNNLLMHEAVNKGSLYRIQLVMDISSLSTKFSETWIDKPIPLGNSL